MKKIISIICSVALVVSLVFAVPTLTSAETQSDQWVAKNLSYSGSPSAQMPVFADTTNVLFDTLGENLITDPTVAAFDSNGDYLEYYDWETRDSSVVVNKNAWWDKPTITRNGFEIADLQKYYASARYGGYVNNDPTLSNTADGSGVLEVTGHTGSTTTGYLPLPAMESYSYYAITFFAKSVITTGSYAYDYSVNGGNLTIQSSANENDALVKIANIPFATIRQWTGGWKRYIVVVYTGNNTWGAPVIKIPGGSGVAYYYDDFGMYKVDAEYGAACIAADAGTMPATTAHTNTDIFPTESKAVTLNYKNNKYISAYENVNFAEYGVNICPDSTVSRFDGDAYSTYYANLADGDVVDALAIWDKPAYKAGASGTNIYVSPNDRGFVTNDTSYSHTADGSGAIYAPNTEAGGARTFSLPVPTMSKYGYYVISFWIKNQNNEGNNYNPYLASDATILKENEVNFDFSSAAHQSGKDWQRVVTLFYTGASNFGNGCYLRFSGIHNAVIDDIEVWKLNDEAYAVNCLNESALVKSGDIDGNLTLDFADVKSFRDDLLNNSVKSAAIADTNNDGEIDICDYVSLNDSAMKESTYYQYANTAMLNTSLSLYQGDTNRFAYKLKQAKAGNPTKIAFLGDSITEGAGITNMSMHYSTKFVDWWKENISSSVELIRRGSGSTDSHLGVHWVDETILPENPDIIFIEYVNDELDSIHKEAYDSLVRRCLALESKPAVVLLEMSYYHADTDVLENQQEQHKVSAEAYGLPMISWKDAVRVALDTGLYTWSNLSPDTVHPNARGNGLLAEMMVNFTTKLIDGCDAAVEPEAFSAAPVYTDKYANASILSKNEVKVVDEGNFTDSYVLTQPDYSEEEGWATTTGGSITFKMTFKNLGILFRTKSDNYGVKYQVTIDDNIVKDYTVNNWEYCHAEEIYSFAEEGEHTVTVTVTDGQNFNLMGWLVS